MTNEEALQDIKRFCNEECDWTRRCESCGMHYGKEALDKQIPKKPIPDRGWIWCCHNCHTQLENDGITEHCPHCGQAIDWSEE